MAVVRFTSILKRFYPDLEWLEVEASTVQEVVNAINGHYPRLKTYIVDEQNRLRKHVNIFVGGHQIKDRKGLSDPVESQDEVFIIQALSGG